MAAAPRLVIDTNVWISAFLVSTGAPALVVRSVLARGLPVFTRATFDELQTRLWKPKFDRYLSLDQRNRLLHDVSACALWVAIAPESAARRHSRDRDDDALVHAALAAQAARAQFASAQSEHALAKAELERARDLLARRFISASAIGERTELWSQQKRTDPGKASGFSPSPKPQPSQCRTQTRVKRRRAVSWSISAFPASRSWRSTTSSPDRPGSASPAR